MKRVVIAGGGVAGMAAALRLAERGIPVTLIEQDEYLGGKLGAQYSRRTARFHEHAYHMFVNWYHNFWQIAGELGVIDAFEPRTSLHYLRKGEFPRTRALSNVGAPDSLLRNLAAGVLSPADMWIYSYSLLDLITHPLHRGAFLDTISVNGFMASRPYMSREAAIHHHRTLAKAFSSASYNTSARTYQAFIRNGFKQPSPMMWVMRGGVHDVLIAPWEQRLRALGVEIRTLTRIERLLLDEQGRVAALRCVRYDRSPSEAQEGVARALGEERLEIEGDLILTLPPQAVVTLLDEPLLERDPGLARIGELRSEPMVSLDLAFRRSIAGLPREHVVLLDSEHQLTFIDNAQLWPDLPHTCLNVVASETYGFDRLSEGRVLAILLDELRQYLPFEIDDLDLQRSYLQPNVGDRLMVHEVGSWRYRPDTRCGIPNLLLAGDYCRNPIDVVTVEGAIVSGLMAAEVARAHADIGQPIRYWLPERWPTAPLTAFKWLLMPWAYGAKALSFCSDELNAWLEPIRPA